MKKNNTITMSLAVTMVLGSLYAGDIEQKLGATADGFTVEAGGAELMRVNGNGNVGIGTATPASKLTVVGLPNSATVTGTKLGGRNLRITDNGSIYIPTVVAADIPSGYSVIYAGGRAWLDKNLGATAVAASWDDTTEATLGDLYQWGRAADGHQLRTSTAPAVNTVCSTIDTPLDGNFILSSMVPYDWRTLNADCTGEARRTHFWSAPGTSNINGVCPTGWRVPSEQDFASLDIESAEDAYTQIKLTAAGYRHFAYGTLYDVGAFGYYWTSSADGDRSRRLDIYAGGTYFYSNFRATGFSVRCVKHLD